MVHVNSVMVYGKKQGKNEERNDEKRKDDYKDIQGIRSTGNGY